MRRVTITVPLERSEDALDVLLPLLPDGVFERELGGDQTELAWHGQRGELPARDDLQSALGDLLLSWDEDVVPDDPAERRRLLGRGWIVGGRLHIRAPHEAAGPPGMEEILIEAPTGAFGTGAHPTTRHCIEILLDLPDHGGSFADLGCGAGVLGILACKLGYGPVIAVDMEERSVEGTRENARRNGADIAVARVDLTVEPPPPGETTAANLPLRVHKAMLPRLAASTVLVSGIVARHAQQAREAYAAHGFTERARVDSHGWTTMLVTR